MDTVLTNSNVTQPILLMSSHSQDEPYCTDRLCGCHVDVEYHAEVTSIPQHDEETIRSAFEIFGVVVQ